MSLLRRRRSVPEAVPEPCRSRRARLHLERHDTVVVDHRLRRRRTVRGRIGRISRCRQMRIRSAGPGNIDIGDRHLSIAQDAAPCRYDVAPSTSAVQSQGGELTVTVHDTFRLRVDGDEPGGVGVHFPGIRPRRCDGTRSVVAVECRCRARRVAGGGRHPGERDAGSGDRAVANTCAHAATDASTDTDTGADTYTHAEPDTLADSHARARSRAGAGQADSVVGQGRRGLGNVSDDHVPGEGTDDLHDTAHRVQENDVRSHRQRNGPRDQRYGDVR